MRECSPPTMCHISYVMCHVSRATCHMPLFLLFSFFEQSGGGSRWRVCYQQGLLPLATGAKLRDTQREISKLPRTAGAIRLISNVLNKTQGALCRQVHGSRACKADENLCAKCTKCSFNPNVYDDVAKYPNAKAGGTWQTSEFTSG